MKTLKNLSAVLLIIIVAMVAGCSDQMVTPTAYDSQVTETQSNIPTPTFTGKLELKPSQEYTFDYSTTGFYTFYSVSIENCDLTKNALEVTGYYDDMALVLGCESKGFLARSVTVRNNSGRLIGVEVTLQGSKTKANDPSKRKNMVGE